MVDGREFSFDDHHHGWADYFESPGTPVNEFDDESEFHLRIDRMVADLLSRPSQAHNMLQVITPDEISNVINSLSLRKAASPDDIHPEHLHYGGPILCDLLAKLSNTLVAFNYIPNAFQLGNIIPILKSRDKDASNASNYRGITLLFTNSQVLERVILNRLYTYGLGDHIHHLQG